MLRHGGRLAVSDLVVDRVLPAAVTSVVREHLGDSCGGTLLSTYFETIERTGFRGLEIHGDTSLGLLVQKPTAALIASI